MNLFFLAWRNIFRQKRRTLITLAALIFGLAGLVVFQGYISETMVGFRNSTIRAGLGDLQVAGDKKYYSEGEFSPFSFPLKDVSGLISAVKTLPEVTAAFPSTGFTAIASSGEKSTTLLIKAYPQENMFFQAAEDTTESSPEKNTFILGKLKKGSNLTPGTGDSLILGEVAARILKVEAGDVITLMALLPNGGLNGRDFTVSGIYSSAGRDKIFAYTDFYSAMDFTGQSSPPVVHLLLKDPSMASGLSEGLKAHGAVKPWQELAYYFMQVNSMFQGFLSVIRIILLLITLFILANTMNRIVFERMKEWGTLRAIGTKKNSLLLLIVLEGSLQGFMGSLLGVLFGFALSAFFNLFGGLPFFDGSTHFVIKIIPDGTSVWWNLIPVVLTASLAAFLPGLRAVRMTPSECLRQI